MKKFISGMLAGVVLATGVAYASGNKIEASITSIKYHFNGVVKAPASSTPALVYNNTTYLPLRFVAEALGKEVVWDQKKNAVYVNDQGQPAVSTMNSYEDGIYRGTLGEGYPQVAVQFELKDNVVQNASFRHLYYKDVDYRAEKEDAKIIGLRKQYEELMEYLVGKDVRVSLKDLHNPGAIVTTEVDAVSGATVRAGKVISAIRDGLNRDVYSYPKK